MIPEVRTIWTIDEKWLKDQCLWETSPFYYDPFESLRDSANESASVGDRMTHDTQITVDRSGRGDCP